MSSPNNLCAQGLPLRSSEESSMSSIIIVPLWMTSGIMAKSKNSFGFLPRASQIKRKRVGLHLLPPLSRNSHMGSANALFIASELYSYSGGPSVRSKDFLSYVLGIYFSIILSFSHLSFFSRTVQAGSHELVATQPSFQSTQPELV